MKDEFYEYICPRKRVLNRDSAINKKADIIGKISIVFILVTFSLPMAMNIPIFWGIISGVFVAILIFNKFDKDPFSSFLLDLSTTIGYFGIILVFLPLNTLDRNTQFLALKALIVLSVFGITCFELLFFVNMLLKKYTARNNPNRKILPSMYTTIGTFLGCGLGSFLARRLLSRLSTDTALWIVLIVGALLFAFAFSFFQKYILYKALSKKIIAYRNMLDT